MPLLTNSVVLDGLRLASVRQLEQDHQSVVFTELLRREFIEENAFITARGCAALDWLMSLQRSSRWDEIRWHCYG